MKIKMEFRVLVFVEEGNWRTPGRENVSKQGQELTDNKLNPHTAPG